MNGTRRWTRLFRSTRDDRGQALAEIAIALPLLLLMLVGIFEFARAYQIQQVVVNAAREGAREVVLPTRTRTDGSIVGTDSTARLTVENFLRAGNIDISSATIDIRTETPEVSGSPDTVSVTVPYSFTLIGPVVRLATGGGSSGVGDVDLSSIAVMRHE